MTDATQLAPIGALDIVRGRPLMGVAPMVRRDPLNFLTRLSHDHGPVVSMRVGPKPVYLMNSPDAAEHVLQGNWKNYRKSDFYEKIRPVFGNGLATSEGETWRKQRQMMQPAFHRDRIEDVSRLAIAKGTAMFAGWEARGRDTTFDFAREMTSLTLDVVATALFGSDIVGEADVVSQAVDDMLAVCEARVWAFPDIHGTPISPLYWKHRRARATLDSIIFRMLKLRRERGVDGSDLLSVLIAATEAHSGKQMTDGQIRDEVTTLLITGHESTSNALTWLFLFLSRFPAVARRVEDEVDRVLGGRVPTPEDLKKLTYLEQAIKEVLRLYPAAWTISRTALADDVICGVPVPKGANMMVSPYLLQRHPRYWQNPEGFDPDRFTPEAEASRPKYSYFPFGGGPRSCIGVHFAMKELLAISAMICQRFEIRVCGGFSLDPMPRISIRPGNGLMVTAEPRQHAAQATAA